jgi:hypothetical protein
MGCYVKFFGMRNEYRVVGVDVFITLRRRGLPSIETVIEIRDLEKMLAFDARWCAGWDPGTKSYYVVGTTHLPDGTRPQVKLHRMLMGFPKLMVDHEDKDTLNNRRTNLRVANSSLNTMNTNTRPALCSSPVPGVGWNKTTSKWRVQFEARGKCKFLGSFSNFEEACEVAREARRKRIVEEKLLSQALEKAA